MTELYVFKNDVEQKIFKQVTTSLRCMVCQNQTLSESYVPLAIELKNDIYQQVKEGKSESEIIEAIVQEQGVWVNYNPPFEVWTLGLWLGPFIVLWLGMFLIYKHCK